MAHEIPKLKISEVQFGQHFQRFLTLHPKLKQSFFENLTPEQRAIHLQCFYRALIKHRVSFDDQSAVLQALADKKIIESAYSEENLRSTPNDLLALRNQYINALSGLEV